MKRLLLLLITLTILTNVSYASFPITENNIVSLEMFTLEDDESNDELPLILAIPLGFLLVSILGLAAYFLIKSWLRAWRDDVRWVKVSTYIVFGFLALIILLTGICSIVEGGCIYNMQ